jgi:hypothetical protein
METPTQGNMDRRLSRKAWANPHDLLGVSPQATPHAICDAFEHRPMDRVSEYREKGPKAKQAIRDHPEFRKGTLAELTIRATKNYPTKLKEDLGQLVVALENIFSLAARPFDPPNPVILASQQFVDCACQKFTQNIDFWTGRIDQKPHRNFEDFVESRGPEMRRWGLLYLLRNNRTARGYRHSRFWLEHLLQGLL